MDPALAATIGGGVGLVLGALAVAATRMSERARTEPPPLLADLAALPRGVVDVLGVLRSIAIVLDASDAVVNTSSSAVAYGLVRHGDLVHNELRKMVRQVRRDGDIREAELELPKGPTGLGRIIMRARVAPLGSAHVLVLAEDHTQARRVEEIRRDFVANVSHELKTPVGGISLLSEAIIDARDVDAARSIERDDDAMDDLHRRFFERIAASDWAHGTEAAVDMTLISRYYERFADHAVSVAHRVIYLVTGTYDANAEASHEDDEDHVRPA